MSSSISKRIRFEVFKRDAFTCQYCGQKAPDVVLQVDHIEPKSKGGPNDLLNLITACAACNLGKSDRRLADDTAVSKQRDQLALLEARREQIEMMLEWQRGLVDLKAQVVDKLAAHWCDLADWFDINAEGRRDIKKWVGKYGEEPVVEAMQIAADTYFKYASGDDSTPTEESANAAFNKVAGICRVREASKSDPNLPNVFYIRGIVRNRMSYFNPQESKEILEVAYSWGAATEELKRIACTARSWSAWKAEMWSLVEQLKKENEDA